MPLTLSVALITRNEEANLARTLASVRWADEIVIVDCGSTDRTEAIAREFGAKFFLEAWQGFGAQKNSAIAKCSGDWVLALDADEEVTAELAEEIRRLLLGRPEQAAYFLPRRNLFLGRWIRHGGYYPDPKLRLFRRGSAEFEASAVHETMRSPEPAGRMRGELIHHAYPSLDGYIEHMNRYSTLGAEQAAARGKTSRGILPFLWNVYLNPVATFQYNYFLRGGFLDGREGLLLHLYHSVYVSWKYAKAWERGRLLRDALRTARRVPYAEAARRVRSGMPEKPTEARGTAPGDVRRGERHPSQEELRWAEKTLAPALGKAAEEPVGARSGVNLDETGKARFTTVSGVPVVRLYTEADLPEDWEQNQHAYRGLPGDPPYTRGIHATGYRGKLWTMRQFSGFASPEETNDRYKYLLAGGAGGLSVAFDLPTLMGCDSDDPRSEGEVGKCGVAIDSLEDMEILFSGIALDSTTVSMTINSPAAVLWAMYLAVAERQGADWRRLSGTLQNDILKEYIAQKEYLYPPAPSMRLVVDTLEFGARYTPRFNPISISGYHIREAGSTALQELAFTLYDGVEYVEWALRRGLKVDDFAPRLSFFFNAHNDFFEEIAKYRAARKVWYRAMTERFGAKNARSQWMRFHTQTAGVSLTAQQPMNNIARVALQALAAVLGGTQSLHTDAFDEALALPTEDAARIALRTQQILAWESGVAEVADAFGGSYFLEKLTLDMEQGAFRYFEKLDAMGGMVKAIESGYPQREIAEASYAYQKAVEAGEKIIVGVNQYTLNETPPQTLYIGESVREAQTAKLKKLRGERSGEAVQRALDALRRAAETQPEGSEGRLAAANTMPFILDCVRAYATLGEICGALGQVFGGWEEA